MEPNYVILLDFTTGALNIIRLTPEEIEKSNDYTTFEDYLATIEDKYGFKVSESQWMTTENLTIYQYANGKEVSMCNVEAGEIITTKSSRK